MIFKIFRSNKDKEVKEVKEKKIFSALSRGLKKTRVQFTEKLSNIFLGKKVIDENLVEAIETQLILADVGVEVSNQIIADLTKKISRKELHDPDTVFRELKTKLVEILLPCQKNLIISDEKPFVILVVGVNGTGKTTSIGKLAKFFQNNNLSVMLAAGDTFRAAAIEQLEVWGERNQIAVVSQHLGSDSASVIFDAQKAAQARGVELLIADTAGRLHTQHNLMEELKKIKRVIAKLDQSAPHETLLVLDATTGQNALKQAQQFHDAIGISGIIITKLDGTAKGGIIFAIAQKMKLPIYFIGLGEKADDLLPFEPEKFVDALFQETVNEAEEHTA